MIRSFGNKELEIFFRNGKKSRRYGWHSIDNIVKRKLDMLDYASDLIDLRSPPSNCLEKLKGDLIGWFSIRINDQWRIIFKWDNCPYDVKVVDYH